MSSSKRPGSRENVRVICRVRPQNSKEVSSGGVPCVKITKQQIDVTSEDGQSTFQFDHVFGQESSQDEVFECAASPLVGDVLNGYNATIFAYGQTGTGKTFTMEGNIHDKKMKGIIPRSVEALFDGISEADENIEFTFKVSYVEIYMEKIRDLLDDTRTKNNLTIREDKVKGIYIAGVTEEYVTSHEELLSIMSAGASNRAVAATGMNEGSSRSHSVFTITVGQRDTMTNATKSGKLVLVDLAGSEMVRKTNASGQQLEEAKMINKSLSALGQVIFALTDEKQNHVPYRDSKLTRILQDSLGGNSKTVLIIACSPSSYNAPETVSTCRFGTRAKSIQNKVTVNQTRSVEELELLLSRSEKTVETLNAEIYSLKVQVQALQSKDGSLPRNVDGGETSLGNGLMSEDHQLAVQDLQSQVSSQNNQILELSEKLEALLKELEEERQESLRKDSEVESIKGLLREKVELVEEIGDIILESRRQNDILREKNEEILREKLDAQAEIEVLRSQFADELTKSRFNLDESEVTIETLKKENQQLREEITFLSGDDMRDFRSSRTPLSSSSGKSVATPSVSGSATPGDALPPTTPASSKTPLSISVSTPRSPYSSNSGERISLEKLRGQFNALVAEFSIATDGSDRLWNLIQTLSIQSEDSVHALESKIEFLEKAKEELSRKYKEMGSQRSKIEGDLKASQEKIMSFEIQLESLRAPNAENLPKFFEDRDNQQMRALQQRLEQLVAVHRQLLRKYTTMELENAEQEKKLQLRDQRIKQMEDNLSSQKSSLKLKSERHLAELGNLRDLIEELRTEHSNNRQKSDGSSSSSSSWLPRSSPSHQPRTIRGGAHGNLAASSSSASSNTRSIRGGSNQSGKSSDGTTTPNSSGPSSPMVRRSSMSMFNSIFEKVMKLSN